jgi:hypothetical protein
VLSTGGREVRGIILPMALSFPCCMDTFVLLVFEGLGELTTAGIDLGDAVSRALSCLTGSWVRRGWKMMYANAAITKGTVQRENCSEFLWRNKIVLSQKLQKNIETLLTTLHCKLRMRNMSEAKAQNLNASS